MLQITLLSLVNIFGETGRLFYNINYMLNSKHLSLVNKIGDKTEFTITRVHCITSSVSVAIGVLDSLLNSEPLKLLIFNSCSENLEDLCLVFRFFFFRIFDGWSMILFLSSNTSSSVCWPNKILYLWSLISLVSHSEIC